MGQLQRMDTRGVVWHTVASVMLAAASQCAATGLAQPAGGAVIYGRVTDSKDAPLVVKCELLDSVDGGTLAVQFTGADGNFRFEKLPAGKYSIRLTADRWQPLLRKDIELAENAWQELLATMTPLATATVEVVVREGMRGDGEGDFSEGSSVSHYQIASIPVRTKEFQQLAALIPGVNRTPNGKIDIKGQPEAQNALLINGMAASDPATGNFGIMIPADAIESIQVFKNPYSAEFGKFTGGLANIVTRRGGDSWHFELDDFLPDIRIFDARVSGIRSVTPRVQFGGPLLGNRMHLSENANYSIDKQPVRGLSYPDNEIRTEGFNSFTQIDFTASSHHFLNATLNLFPQRISGAELSLFNPRSVTPGYHQRGYTAAFADLLSFSGDSVLRSQFQITQFDADVDGQGRLAMTLAPQGNAGNFFNTSHRVARRYELLEVYSMKPRHFLGSHQVSLGGDFSYSSFRGHSNSREVRILRQDGTLAQTINFVGDGFATSQNSELALFFQDQWKLTKNLTLQFGGRYEIQSIASAFNVAPRFGFAYRPFGKTVVRGGGGLFYDRVPLTTPVFPYQQERHVTAYDLNGVQLGTPVAFRPVIATNSRPRYTKRPSTAFGITPLNNSWNLQWEQKLSPSLNLRANFLSSRTIHSFLVESHVWKPDKGFVVLSNDGQSQYREVEWTASYSIRPRSEVNASYLWSRGRGDTNNFNYHFGNFALPVIRTNQYSVLPFEIPNRFVAWGIFDLASDVSVSPILDLHSGNPYSALNETLDLAGAANSRRFPRFASLDLGVSKIVALRDNFRPKVTFKVFNLTNHFNPRDVQNHISSPDFGRFFSNQHRFYGIDLELIW